MALPLLSGGLPCCILHLGDVGHSETAVIEMDHLGFAPVHSDSIDEEEEG